MYCLSSGICLICSFVCFGGHPVSYTAGVALAGRCGFLLRRCPEAPALAAGTPGRSLVAKANEAKSFSDFNRLRLGGRFKACCLDHMDRMAIMTHQVS
jgi:hypothetical protein